MLHDFAGRSMSDARRCAACGQAVRGRLRAWPKRVALTIPVCAISQNLAGRRAALVLRARLLCARVCVDARNAAQGCSGASAGGADCVDGDVAGAAAGAVVSGDGGGCETGGAALPSSLAGAVAAPGFEVSGAGVPLAGGGFVVSAAGAFSVPFGAAPCVAFGVGFGVGFGATPGA
ncbi:hypothetical protein PSP6_420051 [Paraburkholderia tropica]|nr:hypothetical protein PSP6_420051 [Paraburkholderia tropica]